jgi:hypothetical protein
MAHLAILAAKPRYAPSHKRQYWPASTHMVTSQATPSHHAAQHANSSPPDILQAVLDKSTSQLMEMCHLLINPKYKELLGKLYTKELTCLVQGIPGVSKGTNTIIFIKREKIPADCRCDATYFRVCVNYLPEKEDPNRT